MIQKVLSNLFKPSSAYQRAYNKRFFSQTPKQNKSTVAQKQNKQNDPKNEHVSQQNTNRSQKDEQNINQEQFAYQKQNRNTMGWWIYRFFFWGTTFTIGYNIYLVANHNKKTPVQDQPTAIPYVIDLAKYLHNQYHQKLKFFIEPPVKKFLPDPIHPAMQGKTLVLNLTGTLLKTDFVFGKGMTMKRRPGLNQFLKRLSQKYQIVIYSDDDFMFLTTAIQYLDPRQQTFMGAFGKQSMVWSQGRYIKDLSYLNRDLKNIIVIDHDIRNVGKYTPNTIVLKDFQGDENDNELIKLLPLLESLSDSTVRDVRKVLTKLGENPHDVYYQKLQQKKKNIEKKQSGMFGFLGGSANAKN